VEGIKGRRDWGGCHKCVCERRGLKISQLFAVEEAGYGDPSRPTRNYLALNPFLAPFSDSPRSVPWSRRKGRKTAQFQPCLHYKYG